MPNAVSGLWIHTFHEGKEFSGSSSVGIAFVRTFLPLLLIVMSIGIGLNISFLAQAQRADDSERHLLHAKFSGHGREIALKGEVHQGGMDDVILMVAQSNLRAAQLLGKVEELFAALPGTEEAGGLLFE